MLSKLGHGWLGLVVASLIAAYMSTIGTHLNWGSSYVVNDFYKRFIRPGEIFYSLARSNIAYNGSRWDFNGEVRAFFTGFLAALSAVAVFGLEGSFKLKVIQGSFSGGRL